MSRETLIQVENLYRDYGNLHALADVNLTLKRGEVLGFLGPNGAGKSTTMQIISGNLAPTSGRVLINGFDILDEPRQAKAALGFLPEQPPLYTELTVIEYLEYCAKLNRIPRADISKAIARACERCGLGDVQKRLIANLSKGYQQRVGIAQAIIHTPEVVILDEPTVGLDPIQIREIRTLIRELGSDHSVILSTHILPEVQSTCDRVIIINRGKIALEDSLAGLDSRLRKNIITVSLGNPPELATLTALNNVDTVEQLSEGRYQLHCSDDFNPADFASSAVNNSWQLNELTPQTGSLEQMFIDITCSDNNSHQAEEVTA
ncbi:MAG: ATP-binding cassette domain-containing protein [Sulfuriflexus sp.]|nr:ATP-binding cassette domain-containing protein [Sulfuriflexus sp.]